MGAARGLLMSLPEALLHGTWLIAHGQQVHVVGTNHAMITKA